MNFETHQGGRCVATPGPRYELTVSRIDLPMVFNPCGGIMSMQYVVHFPIQELPVALVNAYPELLDKEAGKNLRKALPDYRPCTATSRHAPAIFYLFDDPKARARLRDLFEECTHRRCSEDLLVRGTPATLVLRPMRYTCYCGGGSSKRRGVVLELLAVKLDPFAMGLPTYQDFLTDEQHDFEEHSLEEGNDY